MKFEISFAESVHAEPMTGRRFLIVTGDRDSEPGMQLFDVPVFATSVSQLEPGTTAVIDAATPGYPVSSLAQIPPGDCYVQALLQALLNVYTEFHRADGHTMWAHMDQWEGQDLARSPGKLDQRSEKQRKGQVKPDQCARIPRAHDNACAVPQTHAQEQLKHDQ